MSFVTAGLGAGNLITVGLGLTTAIIIPDPGPNPIKCSTAGAYVYHKKRVKGVTTKNDNGTVILQTLTVKSEMPLKMYQMMKLNGLEQSKINKKIKVMLEDPTKLGVIIIRKSSNSTSINQYFMRKSEYKTSLVGEKFINFVEKKVKIIENKTNLSGKKTKHINPADTLKEVEMTELLDILKDLEGTDV